MYRGVPTRCASARSDPGISTSLEARAIPKVQDLRLAIGQDQDITRLQVAVDDACGMRALNRATHLAE
jgi:hypothetical protein